MPTKPINPAASNANEPGSGTDEVIGVKDQPEPLHDAITLAALPVVTNCEPFQVSK